MAKRKLIPGKIEREVLFRNQNICCICQKPNIQIHHIDGNPNNNKASNLCVLCIEHHAQVSSVNRMTRGLSSSLLKKYKNEWEGLNARKRLHAIKTKPETKFERQQIKFEIKRIVYYLPTQKSKREIDKEIDQLYHWHLFEGYTDYILKNLATIHWFFSDKQLAYVADRVYEFFWHFVGQKDVPMNKKDERELVMAVNLLDDFGVHAALVEVNGITVRKIVNALMDLFKTASIYKRRKVGLAIMKELNGIKKGWASGKKVGKSKQAIRIIEKAVQETERIRKNSKNFTIIPPNVW